MPGTASVKRGCTWNTLVSLLFPWLLPRLDHGVVFKLFPCTNSWYKLEHNMVFTPFPPKGLPVRMHYVYPVLAWYAREKDLKGQ